MNSQFVSIVTPTFNRRPFIPMLINCVNNQTYPKCFIEWIIIDDGTDSVEDLFTNNKNIDQNIDVRYYRLNEKVSLGKKRNLANQYCSSQIIIYMDDDDYYPPTRIEHAVDTLMKNPTALCAGSSILYIYFKHVEQMYKFGPYGPNHATAATFAFRKELLEQTQFDENAFIGE